MDALRIKISGPLRLHVEPLWARLAAQGYTTLSIANVARLLAHLSRWLEHQRLAPAHLTTHQVDRFLRHRRRAGYTCWLSSRGVQPILEYLRGIGVVPPADEGSAGEPMAIDGLITVYVDYLRRERTLSPPTAAFYERMARMFLPEDGDLRSLSAGTVSAFIVQASRRHSVAYTKYKVSALRCLLRYLYVRGDLPTNLAAAVPAVAGWRRTGLPRDLDPTVVAQIVRACDGRTHDGRRTRAAVLLMVRLGLRVGEVAAL